MRVPPAGSPAYSRAIFDPFGAEYFVQSIVAGDVYSISGNYLKVLC
jgi:hypothetical protein